MAILNPEELAQFAESVSRFITNRYDRKLRISRAAAADDSRDIWLAFAQQGWLGLTISDRFGGQGGGATELGALLGAAAPNLILEPLLTNAIASRLIAEAGTVQQQAQWLPLAAKGELVIAFAHEEPGSGHGRGSLGTQARCNGESWQLNGRKRLVFDACSADQLIVSAQTPDGETGLFLVERDASGLSFERQRLADERIAANVTLNAVPGTPLGSGCADMAIEIAFDLGAAALCSESVAIISELNRATIDYVKTRNQFGQTIGSFQVVQHRLVDMKIAEQEAWAITRCAQMALDTDLEGAAQIVSAAKTRVDCAARQVGESAIQLHGGIGMSDELLIGHYYKRLMVNRTLFGNTDWHLDRLGEQL